MVIHYSVKKYKVEKILWKVWHKDYGMIYDIRETRSMEDILYEFQNDRSKVCRKILQISLL